MPVQYPNELLTRVATKHLRSEVGGRQAAQTPMTLAQASYLMMLCEETGEVLDDSLTETEATRRIAELEDATGRSRGHSSPASDSHR